MPRFSTDFAAEYEYRAVETAIEGWTTTKNGNNFTNTIAQEKISVPVNKTWIASQGTSTPQLKLELYQDGVHLTDKDKTLASKTTDAEARATDEYTFSSLDKYAADGHEYVYTVKEVLQSEANEWLATQTTGADGIVQLTNEKIENDKLSFTGTKTWIAPAGTELPTITIKLQRKSKNTVNAQWEDVPGVSAVSGKGLQSYSFANIPKTADHTSYDFQIVETIEDQEASNWMEPVYDSSSTEGNVTTQNITNTINQDYVRVSGTKTWVAHAGTSIPKVTIQLKRDDGAVADQKVELASGGTECTYVFDNLPRYDLNDGHEYKYGVEETIDGNDASKWEKTVTGYNITNTWNQIETVDVTGTKTWHGPTSLDKANVTFTLQSKTDGADYSNVSGVSSVSGPGLTEFEFKNLPKYVKVGDEFKLVSYRVVETVEGDVWTADESPAVSADGYKYDFHNYPTQQTVNMPWKKTWIAPSNTNTPALTVWLYRDGVLYMSDTTKVTADSIASNATTKTLEGSFTELPKYDLSGDTDGSSIDDGHEFVYEVREQQVPGWTPATTQGTGEDAGKTLFTNTLVMPTVDVSGTKTWVGPAGTDRPTITFSLYRRVKDEVTWGQPIMQREGEEGLTSYSFGNLPKYASTTYTQEYEYRVAETLSGENAEKWTTQDPIENRPDGQWNFTNNGIQEYVDISGTKVWKAPALTRTPGATFELLQDGLPFKESNDEGAATRSTSVVGGMVSQNAGSDGSTQSFSFAHLPKYDLAIEYDGTTDDDGHEFVYTVREVPVAGYTTSGEGTVSNNYTITNTQEKGNLRVSKAYDFDTSVTEDDKALLNARSCKVAVQNASGQYLDEDGVLHTEPTYVEVRPDAPVLITGVATGTYRVTEKDTEKALTLTTADGTAYFDVVPGESVTSASSDVAENALAEFDLKNTYKKLGGSWEASKKEIKATAVDATLNKTDSGKAREGGKDLNIYQSVLPGAEITYEISAKNYRSYPATIRITDPLDGNVEIREYDPTESEGTYADNTIKSTLSQEETYKQEGTDSQGRAIYVLDKYRIDYEYDEQTRTVTWVYYNVAPGDEVKPHLTVKVNENLPENITKVDNQAFAEIGVAMTEEETEEQPAQVLAPSSNPSSSGPNLSPLVELLRASTPTRYVVAYDAKLYTNEEENPISSITATPATSKNGQYDPTDQSGKTQQSQTGKPTFTAAGTDIEPAIKLLDSDGKPVEDNTVKVEYEGTYVLDPTTGEITFTPDPGFTGKTSGVTVRGTITSGDFARSVDTTYTPIVVSNREVVEAERDIEYHYVNENGPSFANPVNQKTTTYTRVGTYVRAKDDHQTEYRDTDGTTTVTKPAWTSQSLDSVVSPTDPTGIWTPNRDSVDGIDNLTPDNMAQNGFVQGEDGTWHRKDVVIYQSGSSKEEKTVSRTITYLYDDGTPVKGQDGKPIVVTQEVTLTREVVDVDPTTHEPIWGEWTEGTMPEAVCPTGSAIDRDGYVPEKDKVDRLAVKHDDKPSDVTIIYHRPPSAGEKVTYGPKGEPQKGTPPFEPGSKPIEKYELIDPTTGQPTDKITIEGQGSYTIDSKTGEVTFTPEPDFVGPATKVDVRGTDGNGATTDGYYTSIVVDNVERVEKVQKLTYVYGDGTPVFDDEGNPRVVERASTWERTGTVDPETGTVTYPAWEEHGLERVDSPEIPGYTPDKDFVDNLSVTPGTWPDDEVVTYRRKTYWVTYVDHDGTTVYLPKTTQPVGDDEPKAPANPTKEGYAFDGWDRAVDKDGNVTYTARWVPATSPSASSTTSTSPTTTPRTTAATSGTSLAKTGDPSTGVLGIGLLATACPILVSGIALRRRRRK